LGTVAAGERGTINDCVVVLVALVTLLVTILIGFLVFVFLEVPLFRVIPVMRLVILAIPHNSPSHSTLLILFVKTDLFVQPSHYASNSPVEIKQSMYFQAVAYFRKTAGGLFAPSVSISSVSSFSAASQSANSFPG
jgi:hypothetical protein